MDHDLTSIVENVPGVVFRYHLAPDGSIRMPYISRGCVELWEVEPEVIMADPAALWELIVPEDRAAMQESVVRSAETLTEWSWSWRIVTPSGKRKWVQGRGRPHPADGGGVTWNSFIQDVTHQVETESELARSREMLAKAQKAEAIGNLTAGVAHDFNNLLAVVLGNLELAADATDAATRRVCLEEAITAVVRGRDLTQSLLQFARRARLSPQPIDVDAAVLQIEPMLRRTTPASIALRVAPHGGLPLARLDRASLEGAILNLVINARDAMEGSGSLTIETGDVTIAEEGGDGLDDHLSPGRYVTLAVSDTGPGVPPEMRERIFEPFFTTKPIGQGTGLGLPSVLGFVRQSGGAIRLYSEAGRGATFKLYFPAAVTASPAVAPDRERRRILLVEDDPLVRRMLSRRLALEGFDVAEASDGSSALRLYRAEGPFSLVLTDVVMPGEPQGPELVRRLRADDPNLRAVLMSGYPAEAATRGIGVPPGEIYLPKPIGRDDLRRALDLAFEPGN
jgi:signal transduction histidine kinase